MDDAGTDVECPTVGPVDADGKPEQHTGARQVENDDGTRRAHVGPLSNVRHGKAFAHRLFSHGLDGEGLVLTAHHTRAQLDEAADTQHSNAPRTQLVPGTPPAATYGAACMPALWCSNADLLTVVSRGVDLCMQDAPW